MDASGLSVASAATADAMESDLDVSGHNLTAAITGTLTPPPSATVPPQQTLEDLEAKRKKRLELNRKAAQESRRRKKMKVEEAARRSRQRPEGVLPRERRRVSLSGSFGTTFLTYCLMRYGYWRQGSLQKS